ncbi:MAG: NAD(P)-binding domain-containing protein [Acidimicrobiaceae bacterium]|nr:NAD(P)-binding domain-containing protein [Acidimicrobiaceae bacterium]
MTVIGFIGSGNIGSTVARLAVQAGHEVVLSNSRGPATLQNLASELGPAARAATRDEAAAAGELILVSIPLKAYPSLVGVPAGGKVVMDTGNYYGERDGEIPDIRAKAVTDTGYLLRHLPGAEVVKVFNNIFFKHLLNLARPAGAADRSFLPIAGDSQAAKAAVTEFLDSIGYGAADTGSLSESWRQQPGTPVYGTPYGSFDDERGTPAGEEAIRSALLAAKP